MHIIFVRKILTIFSIVFMMTTAMAVANPVVPPGERVDFRFKPPASFVGGGLRSGLANFIQPYTIAWDISNQGGGIFKYNYTMSPLLWNGFFLQSTSGMSAASITNLTINTGLLSGIGNSAVDRTFGSVIGILFTKSILINLPVRSVSFEINAVPEFGSFRHGVLVFDEIPNAFVRNLGYGSPFVFNTNNFVPVIGVKTPDVPTYLAVASMLGVGGLLIQLRKRCRKREESV